MSTTYTPTADWPAGYTLPDDGDGPVSAADVNTGLEAVGDRTELLGEQVFDRWYPVAWPALLNENTRFAWDAANMWNQASVADVGLLQLAITGLPPGGTITNLRFAANGRSGGAGHAGSLPATMPVVELEIYDDDGAQGEALSTTDDSASAAAYDLTHEVVGAGVAAGTLLTDGVTYVAQVFGEAGANSVAGALSFRRIEVYVERAP